MTRLLAFHTDSPAERLSSAPEARLLQQAGIELRGKRCTSDDEVIEGAQEADAILNGLVPITRRVLESLPRLKVVARYGVGVDNVDLDAATEQGVVVTYVPDYCEEEVSNQALALLLAWARQVPRFDAMLHAGGWGYDFVPSMQSVHQQKLGLVGAGRIGRALGRKGLALQMEVLAFDSYVPREDLSELGFEAVSLEQLAATCDYVSVHVPLTEETRHLISTDQLAMMKPSAFLINTSRGPVVDEHALINALEKGQIAGAGLDVYEQEPLPADSPLRTMSNVILTPHVGAQSPVASARLRQRIAEEVIRALKGEFPINVANGAVRANARLDVQ